MRLLAFADTHGDMESLNIIRKKAAQADLLICAGDISQMESNILNILTEINNIGKPVLMIHGNHEDELGLKEKCVQFENIIFLHKGIHTVNNNIFMGYGGDGFSTVDNDFTIVANAFFKPESKGKNRIILITHGPAHDTVIDKVNGQNRGNKSYREFINNINPHLVISGHLHETAGMHHKIGRTLIINPGKDGAFINL